ncbi:MAG: transcriptional regulator [Candidatus Hydrogenedentota bacterium]|nr:MAG: transcriptional regulator [Candidatus Hydrogenedentota bacterium]
MEEKDVITILSALAQESRLRIFRRLVRAGVCGMAAGRIAEELDLPAATLSFHLKEMKYAGIVNCRKDGRSLIYSANFKGVNNVLGYLMENCCQPQDDTDIEPYCESEEIMT